MYEDERQFRHDLEYLVDQFNKMQVYQHYEDHVQSKVDEHAHLAKRIKKESAAYLKQLEDNKFKKQMLADKIKKCELER